ncbi:hypothetical protein GCM10010303_63480 [Streptomyces purpurascens]|nr:hypothetical protein GCM10010303_63480 [Streptomyces purpurascens]
MRDVNLLTGDEVSLPWALGLDLNTAFLASASRLVVGLSAPDHFRAPVFNPKIPGSWLVDLSHVELDPRLPSPFTPSGTRPTGPAWYQTHTVAYAQELGYNVQPLEALRRVHAGAAQDAEGPDRLPDPAVGQREGRRPGNRCHRRLRQPLPARRPQAPPLRRRHEDRRCGTCSPAA